MSRKAAILVMDDEHCIRESSGMALNSNYNMLMAESGQAEIEKFTNRSIGLVLLDIILPDPDGLVLSKKFMELDTDMEVIMVNASKGLPPAVSPVKYEEYDYTARPLAVEDIMRIVNHTIEKHNLLKDVPYIRDETDRYKPFEKIIGKDSKMTALFDLIATIKDGDGPVLIQGESGTGKELVARAIHNLGNRQNQPFVVINCAAIPDTLMESEIFGHTKGAFTGAAINKTGKLETADKGVVFLDDIDTLEINMQAKLLRVIQEKEFEKLGSNKLLKIDVRYIAASNKNLHELVAEDKFREDLYYRLNVFPVVIPPLRERKEDIPLLLNHFLECNSKKIGKLCKKFSSSAVKFLTHHYNWPGNVRELQNLVERLVTITKENTIYPRDISSLSPVKREIRELSLKDAVSVFEKQYISEVLERVHGNRKNAADILGIHRNTLQSKISE